MEEAVDDTIDISDLNITEQSAEDTSNDLSTSDISEDTYDDNLDSNEENFSDYIPENIEDNMSGVDISDGVNNLGENVGKDFDENSSNDLLDDVPEDRFKGDGSKEEYDFNDNVPVEALDDIPENDSESDTEDEIIDVSDRYSDINNNGELEIEDGDEDIPDVLEEDSYENVSESGEMTETQDETDDIPEDTSGNLNSYIIDTIMNSDMTQEEKAQYLRDLKEKLQTYASDSEDYQEKAVEPEIYDDIEEDEDSAVKVKTYSGWNTGTSHHDYEQELYDLDEGIENWQSLMEDISGNLDKEAEQIQNDPTLSDEERNIQLDENASKRSSFEDQYMKEYADLMARRDYINNKISQ